MSKRDWLKHLGFATAIAISKPTKQITDEEYKQLEHLLGKLENVVGNKICIIPNYIHDGYHIGVYNSSGEPVISAIGPTIKDTVEKLKQNSNGK